MNMEFNIEQARTNMIQQQIRTWDVLDETVLEVIGAVPRERFVPQHLQKLAFVDTELPLGRGQVMMAPKLEARMLQTLDIQKSEQVLEIGTGSGYTAACMARLGMHVETVDISRPVRNRHSRIVASTM
jgi:protein-L-isoaspartate(D-aspartate) O-methyltransferase